MFFLHHITPRFLVFLASGTLLASASHAQTAAPKSNANAATAAPFRSTFEGYRAYSDNDPLDWKAGNWKAANDNVARIGGWREYAKQAQQPENAPAQESKALNAAPKPANEATTNATTKAKP